MTLNLGVEREFKSAHNTAFALAQTVEFAETKQAEWPETRIFEVSGDALANLTR